MSGPRLNTFRNRTELEDTYMKERNIPYKLICNQNNHEKIQKNLLEGSVLLNNEEIDYSLLNKNYSDRIYQRNLPSKNLPVNIDFRPLPGDSKCTLNRFQEERDSLEKYNKYEVNLKCNEEVFVPNKGTVNGFFNNIDLDSELKTINQVDTKCKERLYKINPNSDKSKLNCFKDVLVKNSDDTYGYSWCNFNKCSNLESFNKCDDLNCPRPHPMYENVPYRRLTGEYNNSNNNNSLHMGKLTSGQIIERNNLNNALLNIKLLQEKRELEMEESLNNNNSNKNIPKIKPSNIKQYKSKGATNVYAPVIRKEDIDLEKAYRIGQIKGLKKNLDMKIDKNLKKMKTCDPLRTYNSDTQPIDNSYCNLGNIDHYNLDCRGQTKNLYKFNNLVNNDKNCLYCEQMFNNQTKRKHISTGRVPDHILYS